jgi:nucleotide-binding universal stress UspA family protein
VDLTDRFAPVVVGLDGSALADEAAHAAVAEARRRLLTVHLVRAFDWPGPASPAAPPPAGRETARRAASTGLSRLRDALLRDYPGGRITTAVIDGRAATVLVAESASATMLVLGARGEGRLAEVLGPVRATVVRRSASPVLSAAAAAPWNDRAPVVVGVDRGDQASTRHLLSTGLLEAATRSTDLVVVDLRGPAPGTPSPDPDLSAACRGLHATSPHVQVLLSQADDSSPRRLLHHDGGAQLLIMGRGGSAEPLTGILRSVLAQSVVPVLVVPQVSDVRARGPVRALSATTPRMTASWPAPSGLTREPVCAGGTGAGEVATDHGARTRPAPESAPAPDHRRSR